MTSDIEPLVMCPLATDTSSEIFASVFIRHIALYSLVLSVSDLGVRVTPASKNELGNVHSSSVLWKTQC